MTQFASAAAESLIAEEQPFVAHAPADELDPHWRPQHLYLQGITYTHLFSFDDLDGVIDALEGWTGVTLPRRPVNATGSSKAGGVDVPGAHQLEPAILDTLPRVSKSCFFDDRLNQLIDATFAQDIELKALDEEGAMAKLKNHDVTEDEVQLHIENGKFVHKLGFRDVAIAELYKLALINKEGITEEWEFTEWAHGVTGKPMGKAYQAWSAAQYISAYNDLKITKIKK